MFHFIRNYQTIFQSGCTILHVGQQCVRDPVSLHPGQYLVLSLFLILTVLVGVLWYIIVILVCISLMASDFEHLFLVYLPSLYPFS